MKRLLFFLGALGIILGAASLASAAAIVPGFGTSTLPRNDDGSTGLVSTGFSMNFFGATYTNLYVNNNGNVTFDFPMSTFTPFGLVATGTRLIAPFFADVDTRGLGPPASAEVTYGTGTFGGRDAFGVNWDGVGVGYYSGRTDKLNKFQLILVDRSDVGAGDFDIRYNYDQIQWETGEASGGTNGLGGTSAAVGYSNGTVAGSYELPGSRVPGSFLDSGPLSLVAGSNIGVPGTLVYQVRNGIVDPGVVPEPATILSFLGMSLFGLGLARRRRTA